MNTEPLKDIPFTQFLLPNGRRKETIIQRPAAIAHKAESIRREGYRFEIEVLSTGAVSMTIEGEEETVAHEIVPNGPEVPLAVDKLVEDAWTFLHTYQP